MGPGLINGTRIAEVRSALLRIALPPNATVVNLEGKTVMPGLINGHGPLGLVRGTTADGHNYMPENVQRQLEQYEHYGVTTVMSLGMNKDLVHELKARQARGELGGATILDADRGIGSPGGMPPVKVGADQLYRPNSPEEARRDVDEMAGRHPDLIKMWIDDSLGKLPKMQPAIYQAVIDEGHKKSLRVAAHLYYGADAQRLVENGIDVIAHSVRDAAIGPETVRLIKSRHVYYIPTLQLEESFYAYAEHPEWLEVPFFAGALQAIRCATLGSAEMLHIAGETGNVAKGKYADLVVLNGDPTVEIRNTRQIRVVYHRGKAVRAGQERA